MTAQSMLYEIKIMLFHEDWVSYFILCKNSSACDESWNTYVHIHLVGFRFNHFIKTLHSNKLLCQQSIDFIYLTLLLIANILQLLYVCVCVFFFFFFITKSLIMVKAIQLREPPVTLYWIVHPSDKYIMNAVSQKWKSMLSNKSPFFSLLLLFQDIFLSML